MFFCGPTAISKALHTKSNQYSTPGGTRFFFGKGEFYSRSPTLDRLVLRPRYLGWPGPSRSLIPTLGDRDTIDRSGSLFLSVSSMRPDVDTKCADADSSFLQKTSKHSWVPKSLLPPPLTLPPVCSSCLVYCTTPVLFETCTGCCFFERCAFCSPSHWCGGKVVCSARFLSIRVVCSPALSFLIKVSADANPLVVFSCNSVSP